MKQVLILALLAISLGAMAEPINTRNMIKAKACSSLNSAKYAVQNDALQKLRDEASKKCLRKGLSEWESVADVEEFEGALGDLCVRAEIVCR